MNIYKSLSLIMVIGVELLVGTNTNMKYVVFNGESCNNPGDFGRTCLEYSNSGVLEVVRESAGNYIVYFIEPFPNNNYAVLTTSNLQETYGAFSSIGGNDDSLNSYYGVSRYFVRIDTRRLGDLEWEDRRRDSDYISVVCNPQIGDGEMQLVVFNGEDCTGGTCNTIMSDGIDKVDALTNGSYEVVFDSPQLTTNYLVIASSNVWGTGGSITSIGGNTVTGHQYEGLTKQSVTIVSRAMGTNVPQASDYISMIVGIPSDMVKYASFDGSDCTGNGNYGATCRVLHNNILNGVQEVVREDNGKYKIYWVSSFSDNNYVVLCDSNVLGPGGTVCGLGGNNVGSSSAYGISIHFAEIQTRQMHNNIASDSNFISVIAFE